MFCFIQSVRLYYRNDSSDLKNPEFMKQSSFPYWFSCLIVRCFFICSFHSIAAAIILPERTYVTTYGINHLLLRKGNCFGERKWFSAHTCYAIFLTSENYIQYAPWFEQSQPLSTTQIVNTIKSNKKYLFLGINIKKMETAYWTSKFNSATAFLFFHRRVHPVFTNGTIQLSGLMGSFSLSPFFKKKNL